MNSEKNEKHAKEIVCNWISNNSVRPNNESLSENQSNESSKIHSKKILEENLKSKLKMMNRISPSHGFTRQMEGSTMKLEKRESIDWYDRPPQRLFAEPWERECDLTSYRYNDGEYKLHLNISAVQHAFNDTVISDDALHDKEPNIKSKVETICIHENFSRIGTRVWDCSIYMVRWFEYMKQKRNKIYNLNKMNDENQDPIRILELGAGTGLLSIALAKLYDANVIATEYGPIMTHLEKNCQTNFHKNHDINDIIRGSISCIELDWYADQSKSMKSYLPFHIVVVCDCTLTPDDSKALIEVMKQFVTPRTVFYVGVCREREGSAIFWKLIQEIFDSIEILVHPKNESQSILQELFSVPFSNIKIKSSIENDDWGYSSTRHIIARLHKN